MKDINGRDIVLKDKAVAIGSEADETQVNGRIGVIRKFSNDNPSTQVMVGNEGVEFIWGAWCDPDEVVILVR